MDPIDRPNDDFREKLTLDQIHHICSANGLPIPSSIVPEPRGNEKVIYHLDDQYCLQFLVEERDATPLRLLTHIPEVPSPELIAWHEGDGDDDVSYLITTRCPGDRLDVMFPSAPPVEQQAILFALGAGLAQYHRLDPDAIVDTVVSLDESELLLDRRAANDGGLKGSQVRFRNAMVSIAALLRAVDDTPDELIQALSEHLDREPDPQFAPPGLTHYEPWAEHYILNHEDDQYRLTGCVDIERILIADPAHEIGVLAASILALKREWLDAFTDGYRTCHELPDHLEERIRHLAIDHDLWSLGELANEVEWRGGKLVDADGSEPARYRINWASGHARRLRHWFGLDDTFDELLFRAQIGPW